MIIIKKLTTMKTIKDYLKEKTDETDLDIVNLYEGGDTFDDLNEKVHDYINQQEVIYYEKAMEYLMKNDDSLKESLAIAEELGYTPKELSSEILATLLYQEELRELWADMGHELLELFDKHAVQTEYSTDEEE